MQAGYSVGMDFLATLTGCFGALALFATGAASVALVDYRVSGTRRDEARSWARWGFWLSIGWGGALGGLLLWTHVARFGWSGMPQWTELVLTIVPVVCGVVPSGIVGVVSRAPSAGSPDKRPLWRDWVDAY